MFIMCIKVTNRETYGVRSYQISLHALMRKIFLYIFIIELEIEFNAGASTDLVLYCTPRRMKRYGTNGSTTTKT